jgi:NADH-quinone oxidoreductase subunit C
MSLSQILECRNVTVAQTIERMKAAFPGLDTSEFRGQTRVVVPVESLYEVLRTLKEECGFDLLADITCVDYLHYRDAKDRFGLVYVLSNTKTDGRIVVRTYVNDPTPEEVPGTVCRDGPEGASHKRCLAPFPEPCVPSTVGLWRAADWLEREVWDMFGIRFAGHTDLRRVLLPEEFAAHPLRKDYPLQGRGERHNFPVITRAEG